MQLHDSQSIGTLFIGCATLMSAYALTLRIREHFKEHPDPKLTYLTLTEFDKFRQHLADFQHEHKQDLDALRTELHNVQLHGLNSLQRSFSKHTRRLASLHTQTQMLAQRLYEVSLKTDKLFEKTK